MEPITTPTLGPLQSVKVDMDKRKLVLVGVFPTRPVVVLGMKFASEVGELVRWFKVVADDNYVVPIPDEVVGYVEVIVGTKYPHAEFSTKEVQIPPIVGNQP